MMCQDMIKLKSVAPMYFLAKDAQDRARWLVGLAHFRKEFSKGLKSDSVRQSPEKRISSFIESPMSFKQSHLMSSGSASGSPSSSRQGTISMENKAQ
eukprot:jgi/Hompol1/5470/HPOL_004465-RA